jgi:prolycopene isomerase
MAHEIFVSKKWDYDEVWRDIQKGELVYFAITAPTLVDPSLAPSGEHTVTGVSLMPYDIGRPWHEVKDEYTARFVDEIELIFPGFKDGLIFAEGATPLALGKYSLARNGAMYGWENNPRQSHSRRPSNRTSIEGLYLAGAWSQPGSGTINTMQSGFQTAQMILGYTDTDEFLQALGYNAGAPVTPADA